MSDIYIINNISDIQGLDDVDFLACVLTSWQFDNLCAYLSQNRIGKGFLVVEPVPFSDQPKYRLTESQVGCYKHLFEKIFFCKTRKAPYDFCSLTTFAFSRKNNHPITILRPLRNQSLRLLSNVTKIKRKIRYISLDEGVSSYYSLFDSLKLIYKSPTKTIWKWVEQNLFNLVGGMFIDEMEDYGLFKKSSNGLIPNPSVCSALRDLYERRMADEKSNNLSVILFKDYNVVPDSYSIDVFRRILSTLSSFDVNIIIKKHPSDIESLFDNALLQDFPHVKIINSVVGGEELMAVYCPLLIIGGYSTVVFTSSLIFQTPAISYAPMYVHDDTISVSLRKNIQYFAKQLENSIAFCDNFETIEQQMLSILK